MFEPHPTTGDLVCCLLNVLADTPATRSSLLQVTEELSAPLADE